jgi:hypothetical protein
MDFKVLDSNMQLRAKRLIDELLATAYCKRLIDPYDVTEWDELRAHVASVAKSSKRSSQYSTRIIEGVFTIMMRSTAAMGLKSKPNDLANLCQQLADGQNWVPIEPEDLPEWLGIAE